MESKYHRLSIISQIISKFPVNSQEVLLSKLNDEGIFCTQATLSRDLKLLKIAKAFDNAGGFVYSLPDKLDVNHTPDEYQELAELISVEFSGNIAVFKTKTGFASAVALIIDSLNIFEILGTVAGDDTIFVVQREGSTRSDLINNLVFKLPAIKNKIKTF